MTEWKREGVKAVKRLADEDRTNTQSHRDFESATHSAQL